MTAIGAGTSIDKQCNCYVSCTQFLFTFLLCMQLLSKSHSHSSVDFACWLPNEKQMETMLVAKHPNFEPMTAGMLQWSKREDKSYVSFFSHVITSKDHQTNGHKLKTPCTCRCFYYEFGKHEQTFNDLDMDFARLNLRCLL